MLIITATFLSNVTVLFLFCLVTVDLLCLCTLQSVLLISFNCAHFIVTSQVPFCGHKMLKYFWANKEIPWTRRSPDKMSPQWAFSANRRRGWKHICIFTAALTWPCAPWWPLAVRAEEAAPSRHGACRQFWAFSIQRRGFVSAKRIWKRKMCPSADRGKMETAKHSNIFFKRRTWHLVENNLRNAQANLKSQASHKWCFVKTWSSTPVSPQNAKYFELLCWSYAKVKLNIDYYTHLYWQR